MKKILYIFVFAALTTAAVSCKQAVYAEASGQEITFVATQEREDNAEADTRIVLGDNGAVLWSPKDVISIFKGSGSGGGSKFTSQNSEPAATVEFKGYLEGLGALQSGQYYWAVYPYSTSNSCDGKGITATLPAYQTAVKGSFGKDCHPAMARSTVTGLSFYAIAGGLEFTLTRSDIKSISIKGNNNEALAGTYKATFGSDCKPAVQVTSSMKEVTLTAPDGSTFIPGETYVISLLPATLSKGVTITLITEGNKHGIISSTKSQTVKRAVLGRIKGIDGKVNNWTDIPGTTAAKLSGITYQLNVYTFADSDGDGWGDIKGITQHLDYLDGLGATALWLSPIQTSASYHGYDILDYYTVNPRLGTEADLKDLIVKAKAKDIDIYLDYVLNHSGLGDWFYSAISSTDSPYRSYYVLSDNPSADAAAGKIDNFGGGKDNGGMGSWHAAAGGALGYTGLLHFKLDASVSSAPTLTVTTTAESAQAGNTDTSVKWFIYDNNAQRMYKTGDNIYEITLYINNNWGVLVKDDANQWGDHKWGAKAGDQTVVFGQPKTLVKGNAANDITFGGTSTQYFASFDRSMPDFNYGPYDKASESAAFKDLAASADKWINMGVNGMRLDAVVWIYQNRMEANTSFLSQWYNRCNATYKARGGQGNFYMVAETWQDYAYQIAPYYKGLMSHFDFPYWWTLKDRINNAKGNDFARTIISFQNEYKKYRTDFIDAIKLSNHDENRAGSDLGKNLDKMKLAGAVLLTSPGKPFIYQGEELGYFGTKNNGDEYVRTPIKWTKTGSLPTKPINGKVESGMLTEAISVEAQLAEQSSILNMYKSFAKARNSYKSLAKGTMTEVSSSQNSIALWTMTYDGETVLVAHNFGGSSLSVTVSGYKLNDSIVSNGSWSASGTTLTLGAYSSAVFKQ